MLIVDTLALDPAEFLPAGAELDLSAAGFRVLDADFGEADVELQMQRQALGEIPTDYHPPNTVTTLKLGVRREGEVDLPTAAHQLALKVGEINSPGTEHWLRRDFDYQAEGEFAGSLGRRVFKATLQGLGGWQRGESPDVVLTLVTGPYWYATEEVESEIFESEEGARELIWELAEVLGTAPGLIRIRVTNDGETDWRGMISAAESRDHPQDASADTTAALAYNAVDLTHMGGATEAVREGVDVVRQSSLGVGWLTFLGSSIEGIGHMSHRGVRRLWARVYSNGAAGEVQLRVLYRALGAARWSETRKTVATPVGGQFALVDLGECRIDTAVIGRQGWEWQLQARAPEGSGNIDIHRVYVLPTEQFAVLAAPPVPSLADASSTGSPGTIASSSSESGGTVAWTNPGNAGASDDSRATAELAKEKGLAFTQWLKASDFGFAIPSEATVTGVVVEVERSANHVSGDEGNVTDATVKLIKGGTIQGGDRGASSVWGKSEHFVAYGAADDLWLLSLTPADINSSSFGVALMPLLSTGTTSVTASVDYIRIVAYYTVTIDDNRVCHAERSVELRTDGFHRQHVELEDVWGSLVPSGFAPYASPSGLEGRKLRGIVVPSQGDFERLADYGSNTPALQVLYRPAYLFAREAAE